ncbi:cell envelope integrity EipB family protein [Chelatococcus sp. GCM10030263]|uniref:cell envelope integrity EipB family protein n=1 Tax=Chelatococcus sp. GCM10030263 TaxID=3273387 RepID=UPI00362039D0
MTRVWLAPAALATVWLIVPAQAQGPAVPLAAHRAVYDLSLADDSGSVQSARGRIVYEVTGGACEGYASTTRQVLVLESESGTVATDMRTTTFEDPRGAKFRFKTETRNGREARKVVDGDAVRRGDGLAVRLTKPRRGKVQLNGDIIFPMAHLAKLIGAAKSGERLVSARVFDGSDDGRKSYDTLAVIGRSGATAAGGATVETGKTTSQAMNAAFDNVPHWPVSVSYFGPAKLRGESLPTYVVSFDLYENGIARSLALQYNDFTLKGELKQLQLLKSSTCD